MGKGLGEQLVDPVVPGLLDVADVDRRVPIEASKDLAGLLRVAEALRRLALEEVDDRQPVRAANLPASEVLYLARAERGAHREAPHHQAVVSIAYNTRQLVLHDAVEHGVVLLGLVDHPEPANGQRVVLMAPLTASAGHGSARGTAYGLCGLARGAGQGRSPEAVVLVVKVLGLLPVGCRAWSRRQP